MNTLRGLFLSILVLLLCGSAAGGTSLDLEVGWSGAHRPGKWGPLFVTISDTTLRTVTLEVYAPHGSGFTMLVRQQVAASPNAATYPIYLPIGWMTSDLIVIARDAATQRWLAEWPEFDQRASLMTQNLAAEVLIGTSGRGPALRGLGAGEGTSLRRRLSVVHIPPMRLPAVAQGYDAFDLLVLNQPDLNRISFEQQQAIADWVRAGGSLMVWPGEDPWPAASPVSAILPCTIGENMLLQLDTAEVEGAGLSERFARMKGRQLIPRDQPDKARSVSMFNDPAASGWAADVGFGRVVVIPFDASQLVFRDDASLLKFYNPLLQHALDDDLSDSERSTADRSYNHQQRRSEAFTRAADMLGDVPGVGQFGFGYVAAALIAMMIIVGPVDWFVLKYLGRQPWTWFTTSGWIGLVTLGAIFIGFIFRSGELHFRTLRIIDQAGDAVVATRDLVCIYAPRTRMYELSVEPEGWWQPGTDYHYGRGGPIRNDVPFAQDSRGNRPQPMRINVWNLRFLEGHSTSPGPALIEAALVLEGERLRGSLTNRGKIALRDVVVLVNTSRRVGSVKVAMVSPGQSIQIDQPVSSGDQSQEMYMLADLAAERSMRIEQMLKNRTDRAIICAAVVDPAPVVSLGDESAIEKHWQIIRAIVPVSTESSQ